MLALWLPYLATERIMRQRFGRTWRARPGPADEPTRPPLVVARVEAGAQRVAALDERAEGLALKPGMGIADARAMQPGIEIVEADDGADRQMLEALADWCDRYTPLVALDGTAGLFLDITGCTHLFGGERALLDDVLVRLFHQGFDARAGLAATPGAAWAAARFAGRRIVGSGEEEDLLAPLPLAALRLDKAACTALADVGLRHVGAVMAAPRGPLARRFGRLLLMRLDQALGRLEEAVSPRLPVPAVSAERRLAEPIVQIEDIERLVLLLAGTLKADLERRDEGARSLQLLLFRVDGAVSRIGVGASRPLRDPALVARLFHERLGALEGALDAGYGFDLVRLSALSVAPFDSAQADLDGDSGVPGEGLALFVDRVRARLGGDAVLAVVPVASHVPERAVTLLAWEPGLAAPAAAALPAPERPARLFGVPEPVEIVAAEIPEGPPARFRWRRVMHQVVRAEGPERIEAEWWREAEPSPPRDYFRVEDGGGRRYWLYRQGAYGGQAPPRWFMHGVFA